jgi:integrase
VPSADIHRHTHEASPLLMVAAKNLGHVDAKMVEKHYGHLAPSFIDDAIHAGAPRFADKIVVPLHKPMR